MSNKSTQQVKTFFDDYAQKFSSIYHEQQKNPLQRFLDKTWRKSMFMRFKRISDIINQSQAKSVLDAGCGPGWHDLLLLKSQNVHVTGVDISPNMIEIAKQQVKSEGLEKNSEFHCLNLFEYNPEKKFDVVFSLGVVEYFEQPQDIITKMMSLANAKVIFSLPVKNHWLTPQRIIRYKMRKCPLWFYSESKIQTILKKMNVSNYSIEKLSRDYLVTINI
jgi:2-polyprenyl-3-methyl-5-hydroxy-6-metoxy-1,4-benzoquinol methylase